ncbi:MAG TPA: hypothetical protein VGV14_03520 [Rhodanobacter sp.]|nr:hypothetical protein [Rhodanobacter sp.]
MHANSLIPGADWYYVHAGAAPGEKPTVYQVAAFIEREDVDGQNYVVGLISTGPIGRGGHEGRHLSEVPPGRGQYLRREQLSEIELTQAMKR